MCGDCSTRARSVPRGRVRLSFLTGRFSDSGGGLGRRLLSIRLRLAAPLRVRSRGAGAGVQRLAEAHNRSGRVSVPPYATQPYATALRTASPLFGPVWAQRPANNTGAGPGAWRAFSGTLKCTGAFASNAGGGGAGTGSGVRGCAAAGAAAADGAAGLGGRSA